MTALSEHIQAKDEEIRMLREQNRKMIQERYKQNEDTKKERSQLTNERRLCQDLLKEANRRNTLARTSLEEAKRRSTLARTSRVAFRTQVQKEALQYEKTVRLLRKKSQEDKKTVRLLTEKSQQDEEALRLFLDLWNTHLSQRYKTSTDMFSNKLPFQNLASIIADPLKNDLQTHSRMAVTLQKQIEDYRFKSQYEGYEGALTTIVDQVRLFHDKDVQLRATLAGTFRELFQSPETLGCPRLEKYVQYPPDNFTKEVCGELRDVYRLEERLTIVGQHNASGTVDAELDQILVIGTLHPNGDSILGDNGIEYSWHAIYAFFPFVS